MRNLVYESGIYNNGIYGLRKGLRKRIARKTIECIKHKRRTRKERKISKMELIIKLALIIAIVISITLL